MKPVYKKIQTGSDSLQQALPGLSHQRYTHLFVWNEGTSNAAFLVLGNDGTNGFPVPAGAYFVLRDIDHPGPVKAVNLVSGSNFANLHVTGW